MNPAFADGSPLAQPLQRILVTMDDTSRAHVVLAVAEDEMVRREAMAELAERLSGRWTLYEFDYRRAPMASLPRFCRTLPRETPACVFAHGLEALTGEAYDEALTLLNHHRDDFRLTGCAVVLWLTARSFHGVLERAPDFADLQNACAIFDLPTETKLEPGARGPLPIDEAEDLRDQVRRFRAMLRRPNLGEALRREFEQQIDLAERRLLSTASPTSTASAARIS